MKHKIAINNIMELLSDDDCYYGLRAEDYEYNVGDKCHNSHQLFQDPVYDENDELIYPYCEEGIYKGYYDAGELNGTSAIEINSDNIGKVLEKVNMYFGDYIYLIKGNYAEFGNDIGEVIIGDAVVIGKFER